MKFFGIPVRKNGTDEMGTCGVISGDYQSTQNFIRYNRKYFSDDTLYSVYISHGGGDWKFQGFHSNMPFSEHYPLAKAALEADPRKS